VIESRFPIPTGHPEFVELFTRNHWPIL